MGPGQTGEPKYATQSNSIGLGIFVIQIQPDPTQSNPTLFGSSNEFDSCKLVDPWPDLYTYI